MEITSEMYAEWLETAKKIFDGKPLKLPSFAAQIIQWRGDDVRPCVKSLYIDMCNFICGQNHTLWYDVSSVEEINSFDINTFNEDKMHIAYLEEKIDRLERIILDNAKNFASYDDGIIDKICKRAIREMNKQLSSLFSSEGYPANFTFFDIISIKFQECGFDEMLGMGAPSLQDCIEDTLYEQIDELTPMERSILLASEVDKYYETDMEAIHEKIYNTFIGMLNEHTKLRKIERYLEEGY